MQYSRCSQALLVLTTALILVVSHGIAASQPGSGARDTMGMLVTTEWLSQHLGDSDLIVLDCTVYMEPDSTGGIRSVCGRTRYEEGHIPSAGFADLMGDLSDLDSPLDFALPTPEEFCETMGRLGVGDDSRVVLYDAYNSVWAARVWWVLRWVGFDRAALLDGGLKVWTAEGEPDPDEPQKNHEFGWTFLGAQNRRAEELDVVRHAAKQAIAALGMDFGAVDVMYRIRNKRPYVLEVNSTPSLSDENADTCERYARRILRTIGADRENEEDV